MKAGKFGYPSDEVGKVGYYDKDGNALFVITCKKNSREYYFLYRCNPDGSLEKIDKGKDPHILANRHNVEEIMRGEDTKPCKPIQAKAGGTGTTRATKRSGAKAGTALSRPTE